MSHKTVRQGVAAAVLAAVTLALPASGAQKGNLRSEAGGRARAAWSFDWRDGFAGLWSILNDLLQSDGDKNRAGIDPNGTVPPGTSAK